MKVEFKWHKYPGEKPSKNGKYVLRVAYLLNGHDTIICPATYEEERDAFGIYFDRDWVDHINVAEAKKAERIGVALYFWSAIPEGVEEVVSRYV